MIVIFQLDIVELDIVQYKRREGDPATCYKANCTKRPAVLPDGCFLRVVRRACLSNSMIVFYNSIIVFLRVVRRACLSIIV